jgi:hypothetical protein
LSIAAVAGILELDPNLCRGSSVEPPDRGLTMEGLPSGQPFSFPERIKILRNQRFRQFGTDITAIANQEILICDIARCDASSLLH